MKFIDPPFKMPLERARKDLKQSFIFGCSFLALGAFLFPYFGLGALAFGARILVTSIYNSEVKRQSNVIKIRLWAIVLVCLGGLEFIYYFMARD